ncbi:MAG TPA: spore coat U domain-containing protein [Candidatus Aquirickettsiella sp.]
MRFLSKYFCFFLFLLIYNNPVFALINSASMMGGVDVVGNCTISATPLIFGLYNPNSSIPTNSTARLKVLCTLNTPYYVTLDQGANYGATTRLRRMSGPEHSSIKYLLTQNPTHTVNWGNVIGVDAQFGVGDGLQQQLIVYGQIPPKQNVDMGSYRDVVNVGIIF